MILLPAYYSLLCLLLTILLRVTQRRGDIWTDGIIITGLPLLLFCYFLPSGRYNGVFLPQHNYS